MKNEKLSNINFLFSILIISLLLMIVSCEPDRGDKLDGKWILKEVVQEDGSIQAVDTVWYNFQNTLFMYQIYTPQTDSFRHIYGFKTWESEDRILLEMKPDPVSVESFIGYTDWASPNRTFVIEEYKRNRLVLSNDGKKYRFDKH